MTVHLDISQLVADPRRSGIQRAERELIRHWPGPEALQPCRFEASTGALHALPGKVLRVLCEDAPAGGICEELRRLEPYVGLGAVVRPTRLLNAELFMDAERAAYYGRLDGGCRAFWLVYDFLPWLDPDWFSAGSAARLMPYLRAMRSVGDLAFISQKTRDDFVLRVGRQNRAGPVIPMGGDGLGLERQGFDAGRRSFVMLGSIEPRKNAAPAMRAFRLLWERGVEAELVMIGAVAPDAADELSLLTEMTGHRLFRHLRDLPDAGVREALRGARAMLFPSEGEGFGIPPVEALHAGIPVIVSAALPALAGQPGLGQIRLERVTAETIAGAVEALLDDGVAGVKWEEAAGLVVPGWGDFARRVGAWVQG